MDFGKERISSIKSSKEISKTDLMKESSSDEEETV